MEANLTQSYDFPAQLAKYVEQKWEHFVAGDSYRLPPLPSKSQLLSLLEVAYLAGMETDEARPLKFTICCTPRIDTIYRHNQATVVETWPFAADRPFNVQEVRRLASAVDLETSAIWICFPQRLDAPLSIHGLLSLGSSWADARNAFAYHYDSLPEALLVQVSAPGRIRVYQGQFLIASLQSGKLQTEELPSPMGLLGAYPLFREGHDLLRDEIIPPEYEALREWHEFEWLAYVNTVLSIVNAVQLQGHGGALIFVSKDSGLTQDQFVKIKYTLSQEFNHLKEHFIRFMDLRHQLGDMVWLVQTEGEDIPDEPKLQLTDFLLQTAQRRLAEACKFVGALSGTDGALVLRTDLHVEGFGAEILLDKAKRTVVYKVMEPMQKDREELDSEQFGMRHRSAMRLCAVVPDLVVFVVSQDGGVSLVWNEEGEVCFKPGINTTNANMVLA